MFRRIVGIAVLLVAVTMMLSTRIAEAAPTGSQLAVLQTMLISASPTGEPGTDNGKGSFGPAMSSDGRYVAFDSASTNLTPNDPPIVRQVFLYDRQAHTMEIVSRSSSGDMASGGGLVAGISDDGRYIVFNSASNNLVANYPKQANGSPADGVYLRDRQTGITTLISTTQYDSAAYPGSVSRDANIITYDSVVHSPTGGSDNIGTYAEYVYNRTTNTTTQLPNGVRADADLSQNITSVSGNGRYVTYNVTVPSSTVSYDMTNQIYRYDLSTGASVLIATDANYGATLSDDGSHALYYYTPYVLENGQFSQPWSVYFQDIDSGTVQTTASNVSQNEGFTNAVLGISDDERFITYEVEASNTLYVEDLTTGQAIQIATGSPGTATMTTDGSQVAYAHLTNDGYQVYVTQIGPAQLAAPTGLTAPTPAQTAALQWTGVDGANAYNIYRDGTEIATSPTATYVDGSAPEGTHTYFVTAVDTSGRLTESSPSATITVEVDRTPPTVSNLNITPRIVILSGDIAVTANAADALSGVVGGEYFIDTDPGLGKGAAMMHGGGC